MSGKKKETRGTSKGWEKGREQRRKGQTGRDERDNNKKKTRDKLAEEEGKGKPEARWVARES